LRKPYNNLYFCSYQDRVQSLASWFAIFESVVWGLPSIAISVLLSSGSDRFGRRFAILPPLLGAVLSSTASFVIVYFNSPIIWLLVPDLAHGCCGSFSTMTAACFGYITDRTSTERRMLRLTIVQMVMLLAGVVSPIGLGLIVNRIGYANYLLIIVVLSVINFVYAFLFMPSELTSTRRSQIDTATPAGERSVNKSADDNLSVGGSDEDQPFILNTALAADGRLLFTDVHSFVSHLSTANIYIL
jgi:MFS family permease